MGKLSKVLKAIDDAKQKKLEAYHGTPHEVDRFSMEKIGTGEGAQAYGHGLYFAESPDVAREYKEALSGELKKVMNATTKDDPIGVLANDILTARRTGQAEDDVVRETIEILGMKGNPSDLLEQARDRVKQVENAGNLYKVELDIDPDTEMLDWDLPLREQPESVQKAVDDHLTLQGVESYISPIDNTKVYVNRGVSGDTKGSDLLSIFGDKETATKRLAPYGVKGIRYDDGFSRGKEGGTKNFVVFDDSLIRIAEKNGIPMQQVDELAQSQGISKQQALATLIGGTGGIALVGGPERAEAQGFTQPQAMPVQEVRTNDNGLALNSFVQKRKQRGNSLINRAQYYGEPAATIATSVAGGLFGDAVGGLAGLAATPFVGHERASEIVQAVQNYIPSYMPQSEAGIQGMQAVGGLVDKAAQLYQDAVDYYGIDPAANFNQTAEDLHKRGYDLPAAVLKGLPNIL